MTAMNCIISALILPVRLICMLDLFTSEEDVALRESGRLKCCKTELLLELWDYYKLYYLYLRQ